MCLRHSRKNPIAFFCVMNRNKGHFRSTYSTESSLNYFDMIEYIQLILKVFFSLNVAIISEIL